MGNGTLNGGYELLRGKNLQSRPHCPKLISTTIEPFLGLRKQIQCSNDAVSKNMTAIHSRRVLASQVDDFSALYLGLRPMASSSTRSHRGVETIIKSPLTLRHRPFSFTPCGTRVHCNRHQELLMVKNSIILLICRSIRNVGVLTSSCALDQPLSVHG